MKFLRYLVYAQEKRRYHPLSLILFCAFTGLMRGLLEFILHDIPLKNTDIVNFVPFYLSLGLMLREMLAFLTGATRTTVEKSVIIGIFLGLFPPIIDALLPVKFPVFYGYYFLWDFTNIPWLGYNPAFNFPLGESITIWLSIVFCALYVHLKSGSFFRTGVASIAAYGIFIFNSSLLPMLTFRWFVGEVVSVDAARVIDATQLQLFTYRLAHVQTMIAAMLWMLSRRDLFVHTLRRTLHGMPFLALCLFGAAIADANGQNVFLALSSLSLVIILSLWQNDHFDFRDDGKTAPPVTQHELSGFTVLTLITLCFLFFLNQRSAIVLFIALVCSVLYNYPFYRARNSFPANLKIEGIWGFCAFASGVLLNQIAFERPAVKITALLVFGGWSSVSVWKDMKDFENDRAARVRTLFTVLTDKNVAFPRIVFFTSLFITILFVIPIILGGIFFGGAAAALPGIASLPVLAFLWAGHSGTLFRRGLIALSLYILLFAVLEKTRIWQI
ncbi:MAG: UbiA family prenyltransferase [Leptospiraceae bacterium]|nr:UbiA family prenyltransferase [Leptospiraceae bacterium]